MSTQEQRRQWRELAVGATPGEWYTRVDGVWLKDVLQYVYNAIVSTDEADIAALGAEEQCHADAAFIAAARAAVPALLADVDALTQEVTRLMEAGRDMQEQRDGWQQECEQARAELASYKRQAAYISSVIGSEGKYIP